MAAGDQTGFSSPGMYTLSALTGGIGARFTGGSEGMSRAGRALANVSHEGGETLGSRLGALASRIGEAGERFGAGLRREARRFLDDERGMLNLGDNPFIRGSTKTLWRNLGEKKIKQYAVHHLIPVEGAEAGSLGVMKRAAELGYDINRGKNLIALPTKGAEALRTGLPLHSGGHLGSYYKHVSGLLEDLQTRFERGLVKDADIIDEIGVIEDTVRADLLSDKIRLQNTDPRPIQ